MKGISMMIKEELFAWSKKSNGYQRFQTCWAAQVYKRAILLIAVISLSLFNSHNSAYAQSGAGPGSYTAPRPVTGNGDFKALKAIEHLWYVWLKGPRPTPSARVATRIAPAASKRIAKKKPAIAVATKLTALPEPTPSPVAKPPTLAVPDATPPAERSEIQVFWWPVPDPTVTNSQVPK
jgi:hypothetical protein